MDFVVWACRVMHVAGATVWIGGLVFQNAVMMPVIRHEGEEASGLSVILGKRFAGFAWMCAWTMLVTGAILMLLDSRFVWFEYGMPWSVLLGFKQLIFILLVFYAFGIARLLARFEGADAETGNLILHRLRQFRTMSVLLGLCAMVLAVSM
ncbi:MAG TPA: hypothetical protein VI932_08130 [Bacteroidota bacterium]|nr:hypothetical protein [Bacteroidota bacterium]